MGEGLDGIDNLVGYDDALVESLAAVGDAVTNCSNLVETLDDTHFGVDECIENDFDARCMVGDRKLLVMFLAMVFMGEFAHFQSDAFQKTLCHHFGIVSHVNQLVFD